jgi:alkylation response protein AidB-like acyl-CoA dehydrogenase
VDSLVDGRGGVIAVTMSSAGQEMLDTVERLRPLIEGGSAEAEAERRLAPEVYQAMFDAGLFGMVAPQKYGGMELPIVEAMTVWEAVARIDSAAAWVLEMNQGFGCLAAFLPDEGARELFGEGPTTVAGAFFPPAIATRADGGWRITGRVPFASGCHHSRWCVMPALEMDGDAPKVDPATGQPTGLAMIFPQKEAKVLDTWHTVGMRGTGSADIAVDDLYVPDHRTLVVARLERPAPGFDGPLYRLFPWTPVLGETVVSIGTAAAAAERLVELVRTKTGNYQTTPLRDQQLVHYLTGKANARIAAARDTVFNAAAAAYEEAKGSLLSWDSKVRLALAVTFAAETCAEAVRLINEVAGTSAIRLEQPFERYARDIHVLTQHVSKSTQRYVTAGRVILGLENDFAFFDL